LKIFQVLQAFFNNMNNKDFESSQKKFLEKPSI